MATGVPEQTNETLFARACDVIPGGVNSPVRAFRAVGGTPYFVARGEGPYVWDVEGHRLVDLVQSYGAVDRRPRAPQRSWRRSAERPRDGTSYGAPTEREVLLAEEIRARVPSCDKVRHGLERHRGDDDARCASPAASPAGPGS